MKKIKLVSDGMPLSEELKIEAFTNKEIRAKEIAQVDAPIAVALAPPIKVNVEAGL